MPRKTAGHPVGVGRARQASMRPRPDAAENRGRVLQVGCGARRASMRPRPDAAENPALRPHARRTSRASMRPRPDAAENRHGHPAGARPERPPSMRPRPDAAENPSIGCEVPAAASPFNEAAARCRGKPGSISSTPAAASTSFNEAAARCRGKPRRHPGPGKRTDLPSMRPRPDAAENHHGSGGLQSQVSLPFNEAAARCRGKPIPSLSPRSNSNRLQ